MMDRTANMVTPIGRAIPSPRQRGARFPYELIGDGSRFVSRNSSPDKEDKSGKMYRRGVA